MTPKASRSSRCTARPAAGSHAGRTLASTPVTDCAASPSTGRATASRPGSPGRTVADIVADIEVIADELGVERFAVTGGSGGGPHALACAALFGDRALSFLAAVSIAPYGADGLDWLDGMTAGNVEEFEAALAGEAAIRAVAERERATTLERLAEGRSDFFGDNYEMSEADRAQMARHADLIAGRLNNGLRPALTDCRR